MSCLSRGDLYNPYEFVGASAVWVAQRIPDDHISVVANQFVIRDIYPYNYNFMMSDNVYTGELHSHDDHAITIPIALVCIVLHMEVLMIVFI